MPALIENITNKYQQLFNEMIITEKWKPEIIAAAKNIIQGRKHYENIAKKLSSNIPWYFIGIIHYMECSCNFRKHLHNGDSVLYRTKNVPANRPIADPWNGFPAGYTFLESAMDALRIKGYHVQTNWSLELMLYRLEKYNGFGYIRQGINTPYLWSGTNHYVKGKYVADGIFDINKVSQQVGAAPLIRYCTDKTLGLVT